jgi:hypothetical protein
MELAAEMDAVVTMASFTCCHSSDVSRKGASTFTAQVIS